MIIDAAFNPRESVGDSPDGLATVWRLGLFGVLAALALPPIYAVFLLVPAFVGLIWLLDSSPRLRAAFAVGWWFGFGHFIAGLYWIGIALSIKAEQFGWLIPFAVFGLPAIVACYTGVLTLVAKALQLRGLAAGAGRVVIFAVLWVFLEWVRGWAFTGFPWNLIGSVWTISDSMIQFAALIGVYGLSFVTVLGAAMPAILKDEELSKFAAPSNGHHCAGHPCRHRHWRCGPFVSGGNQDCRRRSAPLGAAEYSAKDKMAAKSPKRPCHETIAFKQNSAKVRHGKTHPCHLVGNGCALLPGARAPTQARHCRWGAAGRLNHYRGAET